MLNRDWLFAALWTAAHQAALSMEFSRQEYWSGLPCPPAGDLPDPRIEHRSPALQADSLWTELSRKPSISSPNWCFSWSSHQNNINTFKCLVLCREQAFCPHSCWDSDAMKLLAKLPCPGEALQQPRPLASAACYLSERTMSELRLVTLCKRTDLEK